MATQIQLRRDTAANWTSTNPTMAQGEAGYETDTGKLKIGDGSTAWNSLAYQAAANIVDGTIVNADINASAAIADTKLATISTGGKVANSATTATELLAAGAIVARDSSGNFTAGTITASLTGAASLNVLKAGDTMTGALSVPLGSASAPSIYPGTDTNTGIYSPGADQVAISTNGTGRLFVDSSGRVLVNTSTARTALAPDIAPKIQIEDTLYSRSALSIVNNEANDRPGFLVFGKSRGASLGSSTIVQSGDRLGGIRFAGADGDDISSQAAEIRCEVDGTPGADDMPGRLVFSTTSDNAATTTERMRLTSAGRLGLGTSSPGSRLTVNRVNFADASATGSTTLSNAGITVEATTDTNSRLMFGIGSTGSSPWIQAQNTSSNATQSLILNPVGGNVGIGTTSPDTTLTVSGTGAGLRVQPSNAANATIFLRHGSVANNCGLEADVNGALRFYSDGSEKARFDANGRFLVGTSSTSVATTAILQGSSAGTTADAELKLARGLNNPGDGATLSALAFSDSSHTNSAVIFASRDGGTWSASSKPTRLVFSTTADGASSPTERMRINNLGDILFNNTTFNNANNGVLIGATGNTYVTTTSQTCFYVNRKTNDGTLISLNQDGVEEGTISVSGTTVSYNGAHLSRWSQLPGGAEREEILRGTVLSNIDEMCDWGEEDNEQLNRMKVSDVEGDKNVSGVFQAWDDDDDTYTDDFYCAMTGDFIIRIAEGVTVQRGDLLMSAGDGTAKPQDDDIIRSKTVAKVTSTHVTCTYDDGSYCVPCVLMAC